MAKKTSNKKDSNSKKVEKKQSCGPSYAIDPVNGNKKVSVSSAIKDREKDYICPHCNGPVYKKAGSVRRHHFAHYPGSECQFDRESDLHYGAKYYLCEKLCANVALEIEVPFEIVPESNLKAILRRTGASSFKIPVARFFDNVLADHQVEKSIGSYLPDVLSTNRDEPVMAWEICVKNPMSDDKIAFYEERNIPYIEITPCEYGKEDYLFQVRRPGNVCLFSPESFTLDKLSDVFRDELQTDVATSVLKYFFDHYQEIISEKMFADFDLMSQNGLMANNYFKGVEGPYDVLVSFMKNCGHLIVRQKHFKNFHRLNGPPKADEKCEDLIDLDLVKSKFNFVVTLNDKFMDSSLNLCGELFKQFSEKFTILGQLTSENEIVGLRTTFLNRNLQKLELELENYREELPTRWINLNQLVYGKDEDGKPCYHIRPEIAARDEAEEALPLAVLADPTHIAYRFLKDLRTVCDIKVLYAKDKDGKNHVFGLQFEGLYNDKDFDSQVKNAIMQGFKKVLFSDISRMERKEQTE